MLSRTEIKARAKESLRNHYWTALLVCVITVFLTIDINFLSIVSNKAGNEYSQEMVAVLKSLNANAIMGIFAILIIASLIAFLWSSLWKIFVGNVMVPGQCHYFTECCEHQKSSMLTGLFYHFRHGYMNAVRTMFMKDLFVALWSILFIIPGIIKAYEYAMVPYILSDDPQINWQEALNMSKKIMDGQKWNLFVLRLSFIGWLFLGSMLFGIGVFFVLPYIQASEAEFYIMLRDGGDMSAKEDPYFQEQADSDQSMTIS